MKLTADTIAAISTAPGRGAISVVRLSGPEAVAIVDNLFSGKETLARTRSHSVRHGRLADLSGRLLDEVLVTVMKAPETYTGENMVEISCHGGMLVSQLVLQTLVDAGCRLAEPGEFTRRAFLNDRIDLAQAEAVAELVSAKTRKAAERALGQLEGELSQRLGSIKALVIRALAEVEARIDFPEDIPEDLDTSAICNVLDECIGSLQEIVSERTSSALLSAGVRIPIIGRPNVGKSSLFNAIVGRSRVIVSHLPGTTRDTVEEEIEVDGLPVTLVDTAGLRSAPEELEEEGVRRTMHELRVADLVVLVIDASAGAEHAVGTAYSYDIEILNLIGEKPHLIVINKVDVASAASARTALEAHGRETHQREAHCRETHSDTVSLTETSLPMRKCEIVDVSATKETGISSLKDILVSRLTSADLDLRDASGASQRHINALRSARDNIQSARSLLESGASEELVAFELREAAQQLGSITGESVGPDILDSIFSRFCVGK